MMTKEMEKLIEDNILCDLQLWILKHAEIDPYEIDKVIDIIRRFKDSRELKGTND